MNLLTPYLIWIKIGAAVALVAFIAYLPHHFIEKGVAQEAARRDKIDADNTIKAQAELARLNTNLRAAQANLVTALASLSTIQTELQDEKVTSASLQHDLAAGTKRMSILTRQRAVDPAGPPASATSCAVDHDAEAVEDIAPGPAIAIERLRAEHDEAIDRLEACVVSYDAVKTAADAK